MDEPTGKEEEAESAIRRQPGELTRGSVRASAFVSTCVCVCIASSLHRGFPLYRRVRVWGGPQPRPRPQNSNNNKKGASIAAVLANPLGLFRLTPKRPLPFFVLFCFSVGLVFTGAGVRVTTLSRFEVGSYAT